jgi:cellulose synthase/poly-beta-1,6-N-acetylglucosamine synthase-like glycosyltransferase
MPLALLAGGEALLVGALWLATLLLAALAGYLVFLTLAAVAGRLAGGRPRPAGPGRRRFAILIPAHNEELLIGRLLHSLAALDYPARLADVCVVADNCHDRTAELARAGGALVYERHDDAARSKGHALRWLLERLAAEGRRYDAVVVVDADSVVSSNFLRQMDARLEAGSQVVQAYYTVLNDGDSPVAALRYAALAAVHYLRPLGRLTLGLSCGLKGNGMCFATPVLERYAWRWFTLAEDVEFHLALVAAGVRVDFAPGARVMADMPVTLAQAAGQNARWEGGRLQLLRQRVPALLAGGVRRHGALKLDAAIEQAIPPLSVPFLLGWLCLGAALVLGEPVPAALAALSLGGQLLQLLVALALVGAPLRIYGALCYAPIYVVWKFGLYARALTTARTAPWIRTARTAN